MQRCGQPSVRAALGSWGHGLSQRWRGVACLFAADDKNSRVSVAGGRARATVPGGRYFCRGPESSHPTAGCSSCCCICCQQGRELVCTECMQQHGWTSRAGSMIGLRPIACRRAGRGGRRVASTRIASSLSFHRPPHATHQQSHQSPARSTAALWPADCSPSAHLHRHIVSAAARSCVRFTATQARRFAVGSRVSASRRWLSFRPNGPFGLRMAARQVRTWPAGKLETHGSNGRAVKIAAHPPRCASTISAV